MNVKLQESTCMGCPCSLHICQLQAMCPHNSEASQSYSNSMHLAENSHNTDIMAVKVII